MYNETEIAAELAHIEQNATNVVRDSSGDPILIETRYSRFKQKLYNTLGNFLLRDHLPITEFTPEKMVIGNHYHNFCIESLLIFEKPLVVHLFNPTTNYSYIKQAQPFTRIVIPPKIAHALCGLPGGTISEQYDYYVPNDEHSFPLIDLKTGKPF